MDLKVARMDLVADDTLRLRLARPDGSVLPGFEPGAHIELTFGAFTRRYSLTGPTVTPDYYEIHVLRMEPSRGGSVYLHDRLELGETLCAAGPFAEFTLNPDACHSLFIAGGIGITPFLSMMRSLDAAWRPFTLHYAARRAGRFLPLPDVAANVRHYEGDAGERLDVPALLQEMPNEAEIYVCGPRRLIEDVRGAASGRGIPEARVHFESFGPTLSAEDRPLTVHLAMTGTSVEVPAGTPILDALLEAGVWAPHECRRGECASCAIPMLAGDPDHRDHCLSREMRRDHLCTCISWARSREITLDL